MEDTRENRHRSGVPTLLHLSQQCIKRHVFQLLDVGTTPYHLLEPVLAMMSAKQLDQLELSSTQLLPYSDKLWRSLIIKDFPDRPPDIGPLEDVGETMPYKSLYNKYVKERDEFRKNSRKRLQHMQKSLKKEKQKNQVVAVSELLRDPSRKIRNYSGTGGGYRRLTTQPWNKNSILGKATRDVQSRQIYFGKQPQKQYDPYDAFNFKSELPLRVPRKPILRRTVLASSKYSQSQLQPQLQLQSQLQLQLQPQLQPQPQLQTHDISRMKPQVVERSISPNPPPSAEELEQIAKRRRQQQQQQPPSIFLHKRKPPISSPRRVQKPRPVEKSIKVSTKELGKEPPSKIKQIKSSIFS